MLQPALLAARTSTARASCSPTSRLAYVLTRWLRARLRAGARRHGLGAGGGCWQAICCHLLLPSPDRAPHHFASSASLSCTLTLSDADAMCARAGHTGVRPSRAGRFRARFRSLEDNQGNPTEPRRGLQCGRAAGNRPAASSITLVAGDAGPSCSAGVPCCCGRCRRHSHAMPIQHMRARVCKNATGSVHRRRRGRRLRAEPMQQQKPCKM